MLTLIPTSGDVTLWMIDHRSIVCELVKKSQLTSVKGENRLGDPGRRRVVLQPSNVPRTLRLDIPGVDYRGANDGGPAHFISFEDDNKRRYHLARRTGSRG